MNSRLLSRNSAFTRSMRRRELSEFLRRYGSIKTNLLQNLSVHHQQKLRANRSKTQKIKADLQVLSRLRCSFFPVNMLKGKVALITGSAQGIGRGVALEFGRCGADVALNDFQNAERLQQTENEIKDLGVRSFSVEADVSDRDSVEAMIQKVVAQFGQLDIVVCCAYHSVREPLLTANWENVKKTIEVLSVVQNLEKEEIRKEFLLNR